MLEIEEVVVNWVEGAWYAYQVYEPFEWKKEDELNHMEQVPVFRVTPSFLDAVINGFDALPNALVDMTPRGFIISDENRFLAVDPLGFSTPVRKSKLRYEDERLLRRYLIHEPLQSFTMTSSATKPPQFVLEPKVMVGLTRREREKKLLLFETLWAYKKEKKAKLFYYFIEFDHVLAMPYKRAKKDTLWKALLEAVKKGWGPQHEHLLALLIQTDEKLNRLVNIRI